MSKSEAVTATSETAGNAATVARGWDAVGRGDWDALLADYTDDMIFVMPGQNDVLKGPADFRKALENLGSVLPPGFAFNAIRQIGDGEEVVSIVDWKCEKLPGGSQLAILFRFRGKKIFEERWFIDTEQWKAAF